MDAISTLTTAVLSHPATAYVLGFGAEAFILAIALRKAESIFLWSQKKLGLILLAAGAVGGLLLQKTGFVTTPVNGLWGTAMGCFMGMLSACAAAGFSKTDLTAALKKNDEVRPTDKP